MCVPLKEKRFAVVGVTAALVVALFAVVALASTGEIYFSLDKNGQSRVTNVNEGQEIWICVYDPDQNINCDLRDKIWTDIKVFDPKTGATIVWNSYDKSGNLHYKGRDGSTTKGNYLEETGAGTGLFVSNTPFRIGARENPSVPEKNTHVVGLLDSSNNPIDFQWGNYFYVAGIRGWFGADDTHFDNLVFTPGLMDPVPGGGPILPSQLKPSLPLAPADHWLVGRFQNQDTLVGMYQDPVDPGDVAVTLAKIASTQATIAWDRSVYKDQHETATITVTDPDENLNSNAVEYVPVFLIVNPGSWNVSAGSAVNDFATLEASGGVVPNGSATGVPLAQPIRWYNIYNGGASQKTGFVYPSNSQPRSTGAYYIQYPTKISSPDNVTLFSTVDPNGYCRVMFYAQETGPNTGVFQLNLNDIATDLGFTTLHVHDTLVAYYMDPNDPGDFHIATAAIESSVASPISFTDAQRAPKPNYWLGRDPIYVQVNDPDANLTACCPNQVMVQVCDPHGEDDLEWLTADETSANSPIFFTDAGTPLLPVWDALGAGLSTRTGGYQLVTGNQKLEAFSGDTVYARYNAVSYAMPSIPSAQTASLLVSDPVVTTGHGTVVISVDGMPGGGLASMAVQSGGVTYNTSKISAVTVVPLSGFVVLAESFVAGSGKFVIANAFGGVTTGPVASLVFTVSGSVTSSDIHLVDHTNISLGSAQNTLITSWKLETGQQALFSGVGVISQARVPGDVSFAQMQVNDTQVTDGSKTNMYFLDRQGNRVSGYASSDCVFVEVVDPDKNGDSYRRERISGFWDGGQNFPFGPLPLNPFNNGATPTNPQANPVNALLGDMNIFGNSPRLPALSYPSGYNAADYGAPMLYVLNPRSGRWAAIDLLETGVATGDFVSVTCIDLESDYTQVPTLDARPGDTLIAVYEDPANHSDSAWIPIKVGMGGASSGHSTATFCDAQGNAVSSYSLSDNAYVKVVDPSHAGASKLQSAVSISGKAYDLAPLAGASSDTFITPAISIADLGGAAGDTLTATYTDPANPANTATATVTVTAAALEVTDFYAGPNPFSTTVVFAYHGSGIASDFSVSVYDLSGHLVWSDQETNTTKVTWDGTNSSGQALANGPYIYVVMATDGTNTFHGKGIVFIRK